MAHNRTESASTTASESASASLHLPSIDSYESTHDGLFRAHMANNLSAAHASRLNAHDVRVRASPVKLRFIRSPAAGSSESTAATTGTNLVTAGNASRIPLPRSASAPDKMGIHDQDDAVQMASYPTPPLLLSASTQHSPIPSSSNIQDLDHPRIDDLHQGRHRSRIASPPTAIASSSLSSHSLPSVGQRTPVRPLQAQNSASSAAGQSLPQLTSPTPPKRHPLRPVLQSPSLLHARSDASTSSASRSPRSIPSPYTRQGSSVIAADSNENATRTTLTAQSPSVHSQVGTGFLTPSSGVEDDTSAPNSAAFTSAFSSPLDSASVPRSFLQQQQQQPPLSRLQSVSEISQLENSANLDSPSLQEFKKHRHKHSISDGSLSDYSTRHTRNNRKREDTAEEEVLASTTLDIPYTPSEFDVISSPGLLSGQAFGAPPSGVGLGRTYRSHSVSSSLSSTSSSLTGSESFSSHIQHGHRVDVHRKPVQQDQCAGRPSIGHSESFIDLKNVSATPKQAARKVSSSSDLHNLQQANTTTPRATSSKQAAPSSSSSSSGTKAALALRSVTGTDGGSMSVQSTSTRSNLSSSLERRRRDGTFGLVDAKESDSPSMSNDQSESPVSSEQGKANRRRARREDSGRSSSIGAGHDQLPRSGTVGDLSFSGSPHVESSGVSSNSSPPKKGDVEVTDSPIGRNGVKMMQSTTSSGLTPLGHSSTTTTTSGSGTASATGSLARSSSTRLLPPSGKIKDSLNRSHARRPEAVQHSSSSRTTAVHVPREIKVPVVPGMDAAGTAPDEDKKSWKKTGQQYPAWDVTQPLWYKAPQWGKLPQKGMRAHSATLVPETPFSSSSSFRTRPSYPPADMEMYALDPTSGSRPSALYVFGGCDSKICFKELYKLDLQSFQWTKPRTLNNLCAPPALRAHSTTYIPPFKSLHSSVYDDLDVKDRYPDDPDIINVRQKSKDGHLLFFGGGDGPNYFNDLYLLNLTSMTWSKPLPAPRSSTSFSDTHTEDTDSARVGGLDDSNTQCVYGPLPSPRRAHTAMWYDKRKEFIIFGGGNGSKALNETWILECKDWKKLTWKKIDTLGKKPRVRGYRTCLHLLTIAGY